MVCLSMSELKCVEINALSISWKNLKVNTHYCSCDITKHSSKEEIHRYMSNNTSALSLKKKTKQKQARWPGRSTTLEKEKSFQHQFRPQNIFLRFPLYQIDIVQSCNLVQYQGKLKMQPWEMAKTLILDPIWTPEIFSMGFTFTGS